MRSPSSGSRRSSASSTTRSIIRPTVAQSTRMSWATTLFGASRESHTQPSSKARVKRDPGRAQGTSSLTTPQSGQSIRRTSQRTRQRVRSTSRWRQVRTERS
jgi:hypothetical protein